MKLLYLVHDLDDAAVRRRLRFLGDGGAQVCLVGFRRLKKEVSQSTSEGREIGRTWNGRLFRRIATTILALMTAEAWHRDVEDADVIVARSLEMLLIATFVRKRFGLEAAVVYECLDIHRLMTRDDAIGGGLRWLERRLLASCSLLVVSSPQFIEAYFLRYHHRLPPWTLLENKLLSSEFASIPASLAAAGCDPGAAPAGPPWRIGWFGIIRCRRSLHLLAALVRDSNGAIEVEIRGQPARDVVSDFDAVVGSTPGLSFGGAYNRATDLPAIYRRVHFNWAIDFYEDGLNSAWLLPNRLYEGSMFGSVPLALHTVETGRWLARHECGLLLDVPLERDLPALFAGMTSAVYEDARRRITRLDPDLLMETSASATAFVTKLDQLRIRTPAVAATASFMGTT